MARKKKEECKGAPAWLTSFSDLMSLLLTFFILLYSMSSLDVAKAMKFLSYFKGEKAKSHKHTSIVKPIKAYTTDIVLKVKQRLQKLLPSHAYQIVVMKEYVMIRLFNKVIFEEGSFKLTPQARKSICETAKIISRVKGDFSMKIEGHAGDETIAGFKDPWQLSIKRATEVLKQFERCGIDPSLLSASGYGNTKPLYTWKNPILQARNRRVEIFIKIDKIREAYSPPD